MTAKKKTEAKVATAETYEGNSAPPKRTSDKHFYYNGVATLVLTPEEFEEGGYAMQAFVDRGPADGSRIDGVVDDSPKEEDGE